MDERANRIGDSAGADQGSAGPVNAADFDRLNCDYLRNRKVCVTGRLFSMTHAELAELIESAGGTFIRNPTRSSFLLVVGDNGWAAESDGSPSRILERTQKLRAYGYRIELVTEEEFLEQLGLSEPVGAIRGQHTISDLARMLKISPIRLRRWVRHGLIQPVQSVSRLAHLDFHQVAFAKRLCELLDGGASLNAIRAGMERVKSWFPEGKFCLEQLARLEEDGRVLLRRNDRLVDGHGQQYFDFESASHHRPLPLPTYDRLDEVAALFDQAIEFEDAGELEKAAVAYQGTIALEPTDAALHFNLGNVCYALLEFGRSIESFREAVRIDPQYAEAWNNLGNALAAAEQWEEAVEVLQRAVQLVPSYADAHFNLADIFKRLGRTQESAQHWQAYQSHNVPSRLAIHATPLQVFRDDSAGQGR